MTSHALVAGTRSETGRRLTKRRTRRTVHAKITPNKFSSRGAACVLAPAQTSAANAPADPQIAMIVVTADTVDIAAGKLAAEKSSNSKVKEFAELMVRDHTSVNKQARKTHKRARMNRFVALNCLFTPV